MTPTTPTSSSPRRITPCRLGLVLSALLVLGAYVPSAHAEAVSCKREIARASAKFSRAKIKALQKCEDARVTGKYTGSCPDTKASTQIGKASTKLQTAIAKRCGGADGSCACCGCPLNEFHASIIAARSGF